MVKVVWEFYPLQLLRSDPLQTLVLWFLENTGNGTEHVIK